MKQSIIQSNYAMRTEAFQDYIEHKINLPKLAFTVKCSEITIKECKIPLNHAQKWCTKFLAK